MDLQSFSTYLFSRRQGEGDGMATDLGLVGHFGVRVWITPEEVLEGEHISSHGGILVARIDSLTLQTCLDTDVVVLRLADTFQVQWTVSSVSIDGIVDRIFADTALAAFGEIVKVSVVGRQCR